MSAALLALQAELQQKSEECCALQALLAEERHRREAAEARVGELEDELMAVSVPVAPEGVRLHLIAALISRWRQRAWGIEDKLPMVFEHQHSHGHGHGHGHGHRHQEHGQGHGNVAQ